MKSTYLIETQRNNILKRDVIVLLVVIIHMMNKNSKINSNPKLKEIYLD